jgi:hypothetical protein
LTPSGPADEQELVWRGQELAGSPKPNGLWDEAYTRIRMEDPKLIDAYEKYLLAFQDPNKLGMSRQCAFS